MICFVTTVILSTSFAIRGMAEKKHDPRDRWHISKKFVSMLDSIICLDQASDLYDRDFASKIPT